VFKTHVLADAASQAICRIANDLLMLMCTGAGLFFVLWFSDQELISYHYSSCCCCSCWGYHFKNSLMIHHHFNRIGMKFGMILLQVKYTSI